MLGGCYTPIARRLRSATIPQTSHTPLPPPKPPAVPQCSAPTHQYPPLDPSATASHHSLPPTTPHHTHTHNICTHALPLARTAAGSCPLHRNVEIQGGMCAAAASAGAHTSRHRTSARQSKWVGRGAGKAAASAAATLPPCPGTCGPAVRVPPTLTALLAALDTVPKGPACPRPAAHAGGRAGGEASLLSCCCCWWRLSCGQRVAHQPQDHANALHATNTH